jgi:fumarate reductase subunit C
VDVNLSLRSSGTSQHGPDSDSYDRAKKTLKDEWISGLTGVFLALFMWGHMLFVSSILTGEQTFDFVADLFENTWLAQITIILITIVFFVHFVTASRKIPGGLRDRKRMMELGRSIKKSRSRWDQDVTSDIRLRSHSETTLWIWQVRSGMTILVLGSIHLFIVGTDILQRTLGGAGITALESTNRVGSGLWLLYVVLLVCVEFHAGIGLYRFTVKWWLGKQLALIGKVTRRKTHIVEQFILMFFVLVGIVTLAVLSGLIEPPLESLMAGVWDNSL